MPNERRPPVWFYLAAPTFSVVLTLVVIEVGLAIVHPTPYSIENNMYFDPDPHTGYRLRPSSSGVYHKGIPAVANEHGHRDDPVTIEKPQGVFRILVLGDSFTAGANVEQDEAYPQVLEAFLNESGSRRVEVVDSGVGGWSPFQYAQYYEHYGWKFEPDMVVVGFFVGNDTYKEHTKVEDLKTAVLGRRVRRKSAAGRFIRLKVFLYTHSHIARRVLYTGPVYDDLDMTREDCTDFSEIFLGVQKARLHNHSRRSPVQEERVANAVHQISRIHERATRDGIPILVALIPDENQINEALQQLVIADANTADYDFEMPQPMLAEKFAEPGIPVLDLLPVFRADPRCLYMNDSHWTAEGHALAARAIQQHVVEMTGIDR